MTAVLRMTLDVEVKDMNEMTAEEVNAMLFNTIDNGKQGLLKYVWFMTHESGNETYEAFEYYIRNDDDAKLFIDTVFDGNIDDFSGNLQRYVDRYIYPTDF